MTTVASLHINCLTITLETLGIAFEPGRTVGSSFDSVGTVPTLAKTTRFTSSTGKSTAFAVLVHGVHNPVDAGIVANLCVRRIDQDNLIILHSSILVNPVTVQNTQVGILASNLFFCNALEVAFKLEVVNTLVLGLTPDHAAVVLTLASSAADTTADNDVTLLGLVTETVGLLGTGGAVDASHLVALAVFPSADAQQKAEGVRLLVAPQLFHVLVSRHDEVVSVIYMTGKIIM